MTHELQLSLNEISPLVDGYYDPRQVEDALSIEKEFVDVNQLKNISVEVNEKIKSYMEKILEARDKDGHNAIYLASKTGSSAIVSLLKKL